MNPEEAANRILDMSSDFESDSDDPNYIPLHSTVVDSLTDESVSLQEEVSQEDNSSIAEGLLVTPTKRSKSSRKRAGIKGKHPLLSPCNCKKLCIDKIPEETRAIIHQRFWEMESTDDRRLWLSGHIKVEGKKSAKVPSMAFGTTTKNRQVTRRYFLPSNGTSEGVCKVFFLRTLGYTNDTVITKMYDNLTPSKIRPKKDQRGKHTPSHALSDEEKRIIDEHIKSFKPAISHYRRAHAPLRLYLPSELNMKQMFKWFKEANPGKRISELSYCRRVWKMKISFAKLGEEECEECLEIAHHKWSAKEVTQEGAKNDKRLLNIVPGECKQCDDWAIHITNSNE